MQFLIHHQYDIRIDYNLSSIHKSNTLAITFSERTIRDLEYPGFGTSALLKHGIDVISVKTNVDRWYQNLEKAPLESLLALMSRLEHAYTHIATYGMSMGAYAAIRYASLLKADRILAISPIYGVHFPWDTRWVGDLPLLDSQELMKSDYISQKAHHFFVYDPKCPDIQHVRLYSSLIPPDNYTALELPYSGHPSAFYLRDIGIISTLASMVIKSGSMPDGIRRLRRTRQAPPSYIYNLACACIEHNKLKTADRLLHTLIEADDSNAEYHVTRAKVFFLLGQHQRAIELCQKATKLNPSNPHYDLFADYISSHT